MPLTPWPVGKRQMGYTISVAVDSTWTEEKVMEEINRYKEKKKLDFLLLFGDVEALPNHAHRSFGHISYSTDLYYATGNKSSFFPQVAYARIPNSDAQNAKDIVRKIVNYERNPVNDPNFYHSISAISYFQAGADNKTEVKPFSEGVNHVRDYLIGQGYSVDKVYFAEDYADPTTHFRGGAVPDSLRKPNYAWDATGEEIRDSIMAGRFLLCYKGRGVGDAWMWPPTVHANDAAKLTNGEFSPGSIWS